VDHDLPVSARGPSAGRSVLLDPGQLAERLRAQMPSLRTAERAAQLDALVSELRDVSTYL
jgi:hypothetical protein